MSSLTITNTFTNATTADATQVNTNFSDVKTFVDSHVLHGHSATTTLLKVHAFQPAGNTDTASSGTFATWINAGSVTVPSFAVNVTYIVTLTGFLLVTSSKIVDVRLKLGSVGEGNANSQPRISLNDTTQIERHGYAWAGRLTSISTGSQTVLIEYLSVSGAGAIRADANSTLQVSFFWEG